MAWVRLSGALRAFQAFEMYAEMLGCLEDLADLLHVQGVPDDAACLYAAVERLREVRRTSHDGKVIVISAADPLNLIGILTAGDRVRAIAANRIAYRDGIAVSVMEGDFLRPLAETDIEVATALAGRRVPVTSGFVGRPT